MIEQKGVKFFGPNVRVSTETLEEVRRERDHLSVIKFTVLSLGGETREVELTGVLPDAATSAEVILELRKALLIAPEKTVLLTSVVDPDKPVLKGEMARESRIVALIVDQHLAGPLTSSGKKYGTEHLEVAADKRADEYIIDILILPRTAGGDSASGGKLRGTASSPCFTGTGSYYPTNADAFFRDLFSSKHIKDRIVGSYKDYAAFLVLPENIQMGQLPLAVYKNKEYWEDQAVLTLLFVPKELI